MPETPWEQFKAVWQHGEKEPHIKKIEVKKIKVDISLSSILDRFIKCAEKSMEKGEIDRSDYEELIDLTDKLKNILSKIDDKKLITKEIEEKIRKKH